MWSLAAGLACGSAAWAQEIPRPSLAKQKELRAPPTAYNFKVGPILFLASAGLDIEYIDNVGLTETNKEGDLILYPTITLQAVWQFSRLNTLQFQTGISYAKYLAHPERDTQNLLLAPDSALQFNLYIGDFLIRFHDQFSYQQDPGQQGTVSGVASLGRFTNTAGVSVLWDLNDVTALLSYDHLTLTTSGATTTSGTGTTDVSFLDRTTDQVSTAITFRTGTSTLSGLEATAATTSYPQDDSQGYTTASAGVFSSLRLTRYTSVSVSVGYRQFSSKATTPTPATGNSLDAFFSQAGNGQSGGDGGGFYGNLSITHRLNRYYSDQLTLSREREVDLYANLTETTALSYSSGWTVTRVFSLSTGLNFQNVARPSRGDGVSSSQDYQIFGFTLGTGYQLTKRILLSASYQYTIRLAGDAGAGYSQNRVRLGFDYQF